MSETAWGNWTRRAVIGGIGAWSVFPEVAFGQAIEAGARSSPYGSASGRYSYSPLIRDDYQRSDYWDGSYEMQLSSVTTTFGVYSPATTRSSYGGTIAVGGQQRLAPRSLYEQIVVWAEEPVLAFSFAKHSREFLDTVNPSAIPVFGMGPLDVAGWLLPGSSGQVVGALADVATSRGDVLGTLVEGTVVSPIIHTWRTVAANLAANETAAAAAGATTWIETAMMAESGAFHGVTAGALSRAAVTGLGQAALFNVSFYGGSWIGGEINKVWANSPSFNRFENAVAFRVGNVVDSMGKYYYRLHRALERAEGLSHYQGLHTPFGY